MVDLEISVDSRENSQSSMTGIDTSKIESKLIEHGFEDVSKSKIQVLKNYDNAIKKSANNVKRIISWIRLANIIAVSIFTAIACV